MAAILGTTPQFAPVIRGSAGLTNNERLEHICAAFVGGDRERGRGLLANPTLGDPPSVDALMQDVPKQTAQRLLARSYLFQRELDAIYPPLQEPLLHSYITYYNEPTHELIRGTMVYVRVCGSGEVHYILPRMVVDLDTMEPRVLAPPPHLLPSVPRHPGIVRAVSEGTVLTIGLQVAGTLAWGLPPPWNVGIAASITLAEQVFGQFDHDSNSALDRVVSALKDFSVQQDLQTTASQITGFAEYIQQQKEHLTKTNADDATSLYLRSVLLPKLRQMVTPGGNSVYDAIQHLHGALPTIDDFELKTRCLDLMLSGVTLQLVGLKLILQLVAAQAARAEAENDHSNAPELTSLWLDDYLNLDQAVFGWGRAGEEGWVARAEKDIAHVAQTRIDRFITPVYELAIPPSYMPMYGGTHNTYGQTWLDRYLGENDRVHFKVDTQKNEPGCHDKTVKHVAEATADRDQHINTVSLQFRAARDAIVAAWKSAINGWREHLPPLPPTIAPNVTHLPGGAATPQGVGWVQDNRVKYALGYVNSAPPRQPPAGVRAGSGPSGLGKESEWLSIGATSGVRLTGLQPDPLKMATHIRIYRRFQVGTDLKRWRLLTTVPVATTSYDDTDTAHV